MKKILVKLLGGEKNQMLKISVFAIIISLIACAVILALLGNNPAAAYINLLQGSGLFPKKAYAGRQSMFTDFMSFLDAMTPMIFAALSVAVALKGGLFNIGVSGMMMASGFAATVMVGYSSMNAALAKPLVILIGIITGGMVGAVIGWLKYKFNINEVVSSIMLNYILMYVITFFINTKFVNPVSRQSNPINTAARLTLTEVNAFSLKFNVALAFPIAILMGILIRFLMERTTIGYEIKAVGLSRKAANYAGISIQKNIMLTMLISGGLAGLAGVTYFCGYYGSIQPGVVPSMGFNAIAVALLGNSDPVGCIFASFLITVISKGSIYMSSQQGVDIEIADLITAVILIFAACSEFIRMYVSRAAKDQETSDRESK
ncbi:MAG: ABC transporter permease [Lachnospiraceae bacterium]|nr:ABC transporter permease [Lachnospiraceae bacterium]